MTSALDEMRVCHRCQFVENTAPMRFVAVRYAYLDELLVGERLLELLELRVSQTRLADIQSRLEVVPEQPQKVALFVREPHL